MLTGSVSHPDLSLTQPVEKTNEKHKTKKQNTNWLGALRAVYLIQDSRLYCHVHISYSVYGNDSGNKPVYTFCVVQ